MPEGLSAAEANHELIGDTLYVSEAHVDDGVTIKRWQPRARGRVARIKKRTCHITVVVAAVDEPRRKRPQAAQAHATEESAAPSEAKPKATRSKKKQEVAA